MTWYINVWHKTQSWFWWSSTVFLAANLVPFQIGDCFTSLYFSQYVIIYFFFLAHFPLHFCPFQGEFLCLLFPLQMNLPPKPQVQHKRVTAPNTHISPSSLFARPSCLLYAQSAFTNLGNGPVMGGFWVRSALVLAQPPVTASCRLRFQFARICKPSPYQSARITLISFAHSPVLQIF